MAKENVIIWYSNFKFDNKENEMKFDISKKNFRGVHLIFRNVIVFSFTSRKKINNV